MYFYFYRIKIIVVCITVKKRRFGGSQFYRALKLHRIGLVTRPIKMMDPVK